MANTILFAGAVVVLLAPSLSYAQSSSGSAAGAAAGAIGGAVVGGPVGAVVGGVAGAMVGGLAGPREHEFRAYVATQNVPSYSSREGVRLGAILPKSGVRYRQVPAQYGVANYRYTVVNDTPVLVDPRTRRIVQVIR
jgi:Protein of unknown function (DUF1236)/Glycine zipper